MPDEFSWAHMASMPKCEYRRMSVLYWWWHIVTHQKFYVHTTPEESKNPTITGHDEFVLEENAGGEITWSSWRHVFRPRENE